MNWLNRKEGMNIKMYHKILKEVINIYIIRSTI